MKLIINNKELIIINANTFIKRLKGLIGVSPIKYGIFFPRCNSIHTFFMKESIDIIGLNEQNEVIYKYPNLPKNRIIKINNSLKKTSILELPKNTSQNIKLGSTLLFKDENVV